MTRTPLGVLTALPLVGFLSIGAYLLTEAVRPGMLTTPSAATVSEAVARGDAARALEMVAEGADLNRPWPVRAGFLGPGPGEVMPLEAAVVSRRAELVALLIRAGADPARASNAACQARQTLPEAVPLLVGEGPEAAARLAGCR